MRSSLIAICRFVALFGVLPGLWLAKAGGREFTNHGVAVRISESRGSLVTCDAKGRRLFVVQLADEYQPGTSRISLLLFDLDQQQTRQHFLPREDVAYGPSFTMLASTSSRLYLTSGYSNTRLFEFDLTERKLLREVKGLSGAAMSMVEGPEGEIYLATYPRCDLYRYTPESGRLEHLVQLDPREKYPRYMGVDGEGWVYTGVGNAESDIIAYHPETGELKRLIPSAQRTRGAPGMIQTREGRAYGRNPGDSSEWLLLKSGEARPAPDFVPPGRSDRLASMYWLDQRWQHPDGWEVTDFTGVSNARRKTSMVISPRAIHWRNADGSRQSLTYTYDCIGTRMAGLTAAPDGKIYGNTQHPMVLWSYDPQSAEFQTLGHIPAIGGGNITRMISWGGRIWGNSYSTGEFYRYDPAVPFQIPDNPVHLASSSPHVQRPRVLRIHPEGTHLFSSGYPGYGTVGGGMLVYPLKSPNSEPLLLSDHALFPGQAISAMIHWREDLFLLGSSRHAPGGGHMEATETLIGAWDFGSQQWLWKKALLPEAETIHGLVRFGPNAVGGITGEGIYFVFDPQKQVVTYQQSLAGKPAGVEGDTAFITLADGTVLLFMERSIYRATSQGVRRLAASPVPIREVSGPSGQRIYFTSGRELWSWRLPASLRK